MSKLGNITIKVISLDMNFINERIRMAKLLYKNYLIPFHCLNRLPLKYADFNKSDVNQSSRNLSYMILKVEKQFAKKLKKGLLGK